MDKYEIVDSLTNKAPRTHTATMISQGFNTETGDLATFVENCERAETNYNIALYKFPASESDIDTNKNKKHSNKTKELEDSSKKRHKDSSRKNSSFIVASREIIQVTPQGSANSSCQGLQKGQ